MLHPARWTLIACGVSACAPARVEPGDASPTATPTTVVTAPRPTAHPSATAAPSASVAPPAVVEGPCPADMHHVDTSFCTDVKRTCLKDEYSSSNKITICHRFAEQPPTCVGTERRQRFCIDRFEYPNEEGARSPVMVDFHDARALCAEKGKRLCWESEWIAACEGPDKTPFPYGYRRDPSVCNIDNPWIVPSLDKMHDPREAISAAELTRLDQGVPSGSKPGCKSGFGVQDQTGNVDEWVLLDPARGKGGRAGLKGGGWGHVRNACRPVTTSHDARFIYYFVSFRCCKDAAGEPGATSSDGRALTLWEAPALPPLEKTGDAVRRGFTPPARP